MRSIDKRYLIYGLIVTVLAVPSSLYLHQLNITKQLEQQKEAQKRVLQEQKAETIKALKENNDLIKEIEGLQKDNEELQARNSELESVRQSILNSVGYVPTSEEIDLLERLIECEAGGESMKGKMAVANVVINRVHSKEFPNTITDIIHQGNQFEPVVTGIIYSKRASQDSKEAVKRVILGERVIPSDIVNFWAKWLPQSHDLWNHLTPVFTIGVHHFARGWEN